MNTLSADFVQQLVRAKVGDNPVTSLYLNVDGRKNVRKEDYCRDLDMLLRRTRGRHGQDASSPDLDRIETYVREEFERESTRGLAIFAAGNDLWEVLRLSVPVDNYLVVDRKVHVRRLENILDEYQPTGVLISDRQKARLLIIELTRITERAEVSTPQPRHDDDKGDWDKDHVRNHANVVTQQHLKSAANAMFDLYQKHHFRHMVIGASSEFAPDVQRNLHNYLQQKIVGSVPIPINAGDEEIVAAAWDLSQVAERQEELKTIERLRSLLAGSEEGKVAKAVSGLLASLRAIAEKRVEVLLVDSTLSAEGMRCPDCGYLATTDEKCATCGAVMEVVDDVVEDAVEQALAQKAQVEFCHGEADLEDLGNIAIILRY